MKRNLTQLLLCATLGVSTFAGCKKDDEKKPETVTIADTQLDAAIRKRLNIAAGQAITVNDMVKLDTLNLDAETDVSGTLSAISNLSGLEHATNLVYLHMGYTKVTNLTPIKDLKKVSYLRMNNTTVADLSPIANYTALTYFNANTVKTITDISALARNTGMKEIILRDVPFGNGGMATIKNFTTLYRINIRSTGVTDISALAELMSKGALLNSTPGASAAGGATLDLRGLSGIDCSLIATYKSNITTVEGC
jgi:hypothetical protein